MGHSDEQERNYARQLAQLKAEHEHLKERYRRVDIENEGRKLAWEIHGVDELLAAKKNATHKNRSKRP